MQTYPQALFANITTTARRNYQILPRKSNGDNKTVQ